MSWQEIATAPDDIPRWHPVDVWMQIGASPRSFGLSDAFRIADCWKNEDGKWVHDFRGKEAELEARYITHWMPLPPPPNEDKSPDPPLRLGGRPHEEAAMKTHENRRPDGDGPTRLADSTDLVCRPSNGAGSNPADSLLTGVHPHEEKAAQETPDAADCETRASAVVPVSDARRAGVSGASCGGIATWTATVDEVSPPGAPAPALTRYALLASGLVPHPTGRLCLFAEVDALCTQLRAEMERLKGACAAVSDYAENRRRQVAELNAKLAALHAAHETLQAEHVELRQRANSYDHLAVNQRASRENLARAGYQPNELQVKYREGFYDARLTELAICDALNEQGGIAAWPGDGVSCVAQMIDAQHREVARLLQERQTPEAARLDAVVTAFEALQDAGYFLHAADGHALDTREFYQVMVIGLNAALAAARRLPEGTP